MKTMEKAKKEENVENVIEASEITKIYQLYHKPQDRFIEAVGIKKQKETGFCALQDISFEVKKGETVGIVGTNGSGKSTLLKIITGVLKPTHGLVRVQGRIAALLELGAGFNMEYTGMENIYLNGRLMGYTKQEMENRIPQILAFAEIGDFINMPVKTYSSGMFARLAFAVAINVEPDILIVDETLSVGDLFFQNKCFRKFEELKEKKVTILFVSHDISSVRQMCSRVLWIEKGRQAMFAGSRQVCDKYMDMKRMHFNESVSLDSQTGKQTEIAGRQIGGKIKVPRMRYKEGKLTSEDFEVLSCLFRDSSGNDSNRITADTDISTHVFLRFFRDMPLLIVGFVLENAKGLPVYDINNYINQGQTVRGKAGNILEVVYQYKMPRLMKGMYIVSIGIAQGTQENHVMKAWIHGIKEVEIVNPGYNSSYIEIPSDISIHYYKQENVQICEE